MATEGEAFESQNDLASLFDAKGVSDETLALWSDRELRALNSLGTLANSWFTDSIRQATIPLVKALKDESPNKRRMWFQALALLDLAAAKLPPGPDPERLAQLTAIAVVRILEKAEQSPTRRGKLLDHAQHGPGDVGLQVWLLMAKKELAGHEALVLDAIQWRVDVPTVESWLVVFCVRLSILTGGALADAVSRAQELSISSAEAISEQCGSSRELPPRKLAAGLLFANMVSVQLLPPTVLTEADKGPKAKASQLLAAVERAIGLELRDLCAAAALAVCAAHSDLD